LQDDSPVFPAQLDQLIARVSTQGKLISIVFIASDADSFTTGHILNVDGYK
jgi:hypothetical protein